MKGRGKIERRNSAKLNKDTESIVLVLTKKHKKNYKKKTTIVN